MRSVILVALGFLVGCSGESKTPILDTGAKDTASRFFELVCGTDPQSAYQLLDAETRRKMSGERFSELAKRYAKNLGSELERVVIHVDE